MTKKLLLDGKPDCESTGEIVCPYCGYAFEDSYEFRRDTGKIQCYECENEFRYSRDVTITYTTRPSS